MPRAGVAHVSDKMRERTDYDGRVVWWEGTREIKFGECGRRPRMRKRHGCNIVLKYYLAEDEAES